MSDPGKAAVAIVDYGMGNLFSVLRACQTIGLEADITNSERSIVRAAAIILPGVGAFGVAMDNLHKLRLVDVLKEAVAEGKPLLGNLSRHAIVADGKPGVRPPSGSRHHRWRCGRASRRNERGMPVEGAAGRME